MFGQLFRALITGAFETGTKSVFCAMGEVCRPTLIEAQVKGINPCTFQVELLCLPLHVTTGSQAFFHVDTFRVRRSGSRQLPINIAVIIPGNLLWFAGQLEVALSILYRNKFIVASKLKKEV